MPAKAASSLYRYACRVQRWLDGDTCDVTIDLGFDITIAQRVRLYGVNAPEVHTKSAEEKARGLKAKYAAEKLAPPDSLVYIQSHRDATSTEKYGRYLAQVETPEGLDVAAELLKAGHLLPWDGQGAKPI